ncbi:hypothetical protein M0812_23820 [Anaeramoeba flamelloides]|uniref:WD repeat-containing protein n=1 Tax=Anaeramoeba flamelloides TaxID=1746091 RepID=A0AAV7YIP7_9EUKA|nr:hypothetical protein M0812_23820 [Anaeramoeba flamelloides]
MSHIFKIPKQIKRKKKPKVSQPTEDEIKPFELSKFDIPKYSQKQAIHELKPLKTKFRLNDGKYCLEREFYVENKTEFKPNLRKALQYPKNESNCNLMLFNVPKKSTKQNFENKNQLDIFYNFKNGIYGFDNTSRAIQPKIKKIYKKSILNYQIMKTKTLETSYIAILFKNSLISIQNFKNDFHYEINIKHSITPLIFTMLQFVPNSKNKIAVSDVQGNIWIFSIDRKDPHNLNYIPKKKDKFVIYTNKKKNFNPVSILNCGKYQIKYFQFSNNSDFLATVDKGGFFRVFDLNKDKIYFNFKSLFGGFTCLSWFINDKFILTGGEDDLISLWDLEKKSLIARCFGHNSWIRSVKFDLPYMNLNGEENENEHEHGNLGESRNLKHSNNSINTSKIEKNNDIFRFGSVGEDGFFCLYEVKYHFKSQSNLQSRSKSKNSVEYTSNSTSTPNSNSESETKTENDSQLKKKKKKKKSDSDSDSNSDSETDLDTNKREKSNKLKNKKKYNNDLLIYSKMSEFDQDDEINYYPLLKRKISYSPLCDILFSKKRIFFSNKIGIIKSYLRPLNERPICNNWNSIKNKIKPSQQK